MVEENIQQTNSAQATPEKESKKKLYMWITIIILLLIIVGGLAFVFGTNNATSNQIRGLIIKTEATPTPENMYEEDVMEEIMEPTEEPEPTQDIEPTVTPQPTQEAEVTEEPEAATPTKEVSTP